MSVPKIRLYFISANLKARDKTSQRETGNINVENKCPRPVYLMPHNASVLHPRRVTIHRVMLCSNASLTMTLRTTLTSSSICRVCRPLSSRRQTRPPTSQRNQASPNLRTGRVISSPSSKTLTRSMRLPNNSSCSS